MRKINLFFPLMFLLALGASAFTRISNQKSKAMQGWAYYVDPNNYCSQFYVNDTNCDLYLTGPVCEEWVNIYSGWQIMYQFGTSTVCWQPYYSLYPNNP